MITVMLALTVNMNNALYQSSQQANAKQLIVAADSIIYSDLNMAGYNASGSTFATATDTLIQFSGDVNGGGVPETIRYWSEPDNSTGLRKLYRYVNNENDGKYLLLGRNFKKVTFLYYDSNGNQTVTLANIVAVRVQLTTQVTNAISTAYSSVTGNYTVSTDFQIHPANL
ncbi:MAG: hypothetical protein ABSE41_11345 [Bacteroidota bacterium]